MLSDADSIYFSYSENMFFAFPDKEKEKYAGKKIHY